MSKNITDQNQDDYSLKDLRNQDLSSTPGSSGSGQSPRSRRKRGRGGAADAADETKSLLNALLDDVSSEAEEELARIERERQEKEAREKAQAEEEERLKREEIERRLKEEEERQARMEESRRAAQRELDIRLHGESPEEDDKAAKDALDQEALALAGFEGAVVAAGASSLAAAAPQTITIKETAWGLTILLMILPLVACGVLAYLLVTTNAKFDDSKVKIQAAHSTESELREQLDASSVRLAELEKLNGDLKKSLEEQQALVEEERAARQKALEQQRAARPAARPRPAPAAAAKADTRPDPPPRQRRVDTAPKIDLGSPAKTDRGGLIF